MEMFEYISDWTTSPTPGPTPNTIKVLLTPYAAIWKGG